MGICNCTIYFYFFFSKISFVPHACYLMYLNTTIPFAHSSASSNNACLFTLSSYCPIMYIIIIIYECVRKNGSLEQDWNQRPGLQNPCSTNQTIRAVYPVRMELLLPDEAGVLTTEQGLKSRDGLQFTLME